MSCFVGLADTPFFGWLSDKVGRMTIIIGGMTGQLVLAFPLVWLMGTHSVANTISGYVLMMLVFSGNDASLAAFLAELFAAGICYSGLSVALCSPALTAQLPRRW